MTTQYTHRVTIRTPASLRSDANALSLVWGESEADGSYIGEPRWQDESGNLYSLNSTVCTAAWVNRAEQPLAAPDHAPDADLEAAGRAQAALSIGTVAEPPDLSPGVIAVVVGLNGDDVQAHIAALGVEPVPEEEGE